MKKIVITSVIGVLPQDKVKNNLAIEGSLRHIKGCYYEFLPYNRTSRNHQALPQRTHLHSFGGRTTIYEDHIKFCISVRRDTLMPELKILSDASESSQFIQDNAAQRFVA